MLTKLPLAPFIVVQLAHNLHDNPVCCLLLQAQEPKTDSTMHRGSFLDQGIPPAQVLRRLTDEALAFAISSGEREVAHR